MTVVELGDRIAKLQGIYNTKKYKEARQNVVNNPPSSSSDSIYEYGIILRLTKILENLEGAE